MPHLRVDIVPPGQKAEIQTRKRPHTMTRRTQSIAKHPEIHQVPETPGGNHVLPSVAFIPSTKSNMTQVLFVGVGGFLGSVARYLLVGLLQPSTGVSFPVGTLAVNVLGCVTIGGVSELLETRPFLTAETRAFLIIGLLGGFTTFSAFGNETLNLFRQGSMLAVANVLANVVLAIGGVWVGRSIVHLFT